MRPSLLLLLALPSCNLDRPIGSIPDMSIPPDMTCLPVAARKIDLLFLIDNSHSMAPMSDELKNRFPVFVNYFQLLAAAGEPTDLHIGVVTADYGAGATGAPGCEPSPGGQLGQLQAVGRASPNTCKPPVGANYISFSFAGPTSNLPADQDLASTFNCMASVGAAGCGFESPLESVYAALHNNLPENAGFLRDDAALVVIFLTNEDDCSGPPDSDLYSIVASPKYGYESSYRCTRFGVTCNGAMPPYADSGGPLAGCAPAATGGKLYDVQRYIDFFTHGVKSDPSRVLLIGIDAPSTPFSVLLSNPSSPGGTPYPPCDPLNENSNPVCVPVLQHSCQNPHQPNFYGDPAVRLNAVINAAPNHFLLPICDPNYTTAFERIADYTAWTALCHGRQPPQ